MPFICKRCCRKLTGYTPTQTLCSSCSEKLEKRVAEVQEHFDELMRTMDRPPVGFCDACTELWIKRGKEAVARMRAMLDNRPVAGEGEPRET